MEQYKSTLKGRSLLLGAGIILLLALLTLTQTGIISALGTGTFSDFLRGFQLGLLIGITVIFVILACRNLVLLRSEDKLKAAFYAENDERTKLIMMKIGGMAMYVCIIAILLAGIVAGYFNETVFFSLAGCAVFLLLVRGILKIYYWKKY